MYCPRRTRLRFIPAETSNEAAFLYQFLRQFGTNNLPDCSNMCHESSGAALNESIGIGKGCVTLEDFEKADGILILGQNPGTNHPRMMTVLERAKQNGAKIVAINPMPEPGLMEVVNPNPQEYRNPLKFAAKCCSTKPPLSDLWLPIKTIATWRRCAHHERDAGGRGPRPGSVSIRIIENTRFRTLRYASARHSGRIIEGSGLTHDQICEAARIAMGCKRIICCWAMGLTQHKNAVATIQEIMNFLLLGGHIGRPGAGPGPVRGHSNVQGDRTMGIWERMNDTFWKTRP
jgi:anaerobic selenocysteine-containing dehydrogenase